MGFKAGNQIVAGRIWLVVCLLMVIISITACRPSNKRFEGAIWDAYRYGKVAKQSSDRVATEIPESLKILKVSKMEADDGGDIYLAGVELDFTWGKTGGLFSLRKEKQFWIAEYVDGSEGMTVDKDR
ncbi:MAG TPA: hypothetical protein PKI63_04335 [Candidatus Cloacimonadota bacterium]|nr:hypothetical protein [Candidatus Cloacimonadota bacterium]HOH78730.1 hypothetical protein [Candidatus Cloacimonadota bacterium]